MARVHDSAVVATGAQLADSVVIGPNVVIEDDVVVAEGSVISAGSVLHQGARVGRNCHLGPYAVMAGDPMDTSFRGERSFVVLEDDVVLREFVTVHKATGEGAETRIGEGSLIMTYAHITHNCQVGKHCVLVTSVQLGGHCEVGDYAFMGSMAVLHQFCRVGAYAMYGAASATNQDVLPFSMARGNPCKHLRLNKVGLERRGITGERYKLLEKAIRGFRRKDKVLLTELAEQSPDVKTMLEFESSSTRGLCRF